MVQARYEQRLSRNYAASTEDRKKEGTQRARGRVAGVLLLLHTNTHTHRISAVANYRRVSMRLNCGVIPAGCQQL